jgi:hypothetical protein
MMLIWCNAFVQALIKWWKQIWFEAKLKARLDMIELENRIESEIELEKQNKPLYIEHPIDSQLQTGESQKLGGAMELRAPWYTDGLQPPQQNGMQEASRVVYRM